MFTVVGLVALVLFIVIITNAVRRRRAKKLDREIAEAAAEAAHAQPAFTDDDYYLPDDRYPKGGPSSGSGSGGGDVRSMTTGYSDTTHGTFAQQPIGHAESYNMAEMNPYDYGMGAVGAGVGAGAAGIGAAGLNRARSQTQPYNAFAGPQPIMPNPYEDPNAGYAQQQQNLHYQQQRGPGDLLLDAAGLGAGVAGGAAAGYAAAHQAYGQGQGAANLGRNPSLGPSSVTPPSDYSSYGQHPGGYPQQAYNSYPDPNVYNPYQQPPPTGYQQQQGYAVGVGAAGSPPRQQSPTPTAPRPVSEVDPYGGYVEDAHAAGPSGGPGAPPPGYSSPPPGHGYAQHQADVKKAPSPPPERLLGGNFASPPPSSEGHEGYVDRDEDDEDEQPRRVLKVRNVAWGTCMY